ncbi:cytochrome b [Paucibacter sp. APW11]|uniref:Cytochrome b n=1 Tax=Roseateles aquae TaxID=3077235 RepID=A0ABU3PIJ9_9BURK|nr:cytochrome b [Paucibacter sp. APW11]MDT9001846.1 cytochrome b [Paucibacter sp. APW11]
MDQRQRLSPLTITLHWLIAAAMITLLIVGLLMSRLEIWPLYPWHKAFGMLVLLLTVPRALLRLREGWPAPLGPTPPLQHRLALLTHGALLACTLLMPLSGALHSAASGHGINVFGLELVPLQMDPAHPGEVLPFNAAAAEFGETAHELLGYTLIGLLLLHLAGALKHHFIDRDAILTRMLGR